jgi:hypothetical protein
LGLQKLHSYPLIPKLDKFDQILNIVCNDVPNLLPIPRYAKNEAKQILLSISKRYPTQGRRLGAFVIVAIAIARGDKKPEVLEDLVYRAECILGEKIPPGQVRNTFNELRTFMENHRRYEWRPSKPKVIFTREERKILSVLKSREIFPKIEESSHSLRLPPITRLEVTRKEGGV